MYNSTWNTYGIFMGECMFNQKTSYALKIVIVIWMFCCFIICASYGGTLKAFLTSPQFESTIETPRDVCTTQLYIFIKVHKIPPAKISPDICRN